MNEFILIAILTINSHLYDVTQGYSSLAQCEEAKMNLKTLEGFTSITAICRKLQ